MAKSKTSSPKNTGNTEFKKWENRILNCVPSREIERDWQFGDALEAGALPVKPIPKSIDLRQTAWKIGDQGSTGSCVGWATADAVLRWHYAQTGWIRIKDMLSVRYLWMAAKETDEFDQRPTTFIEVAGTSLKAALDIARKFGIVLAKDLPFAPAVLYQDRPQIFYALAARYRISSYFNLGRDLTEWRRWLAFNGPILTRLDVDQTWYQATTNKGALDEYIPLPPGQSGGHAVALVGYDEKRFIVRNSWGTGWGDKGFAYASNNYAATAFTEAYGVIV